MKKKDEQLYQLHRQISDLMNDKNKLCDLSLSLLACRHPYPSYPVFLWEQYYLFQLKIVFGNMSYLGSSTRTFLESFFSCDFDEHNFLCDLLCDYVNMKMVASVFSYMGDLQLQAFLSFMRNHIDWHLAMKSVEANEERTILWVRAKSGMVYELRHEFKLFLSTPEIREQSTIYRKRIVRICLNLHAYMKN